MHRYAFLLCLLPASVVACGKAPVPVPQSIEVPAEPEVTVTEQELSVGQAYEYVPESEADAVLVVEVSIAGVEGDEFGIPLKHDPKGIGGSITLKSIAHGVSPEGRGISCRRSVRVSDGWEGRVEVGLSISRTGWDGREAEFLVPWLGEARRDLAGGGSAHAWFAKPGK